MVHKLKVFTISVQSCTSLGHDHDADRDDNEDDDSGGHDVTVDDEAILGISSFHYSRRRVSPAGQRSMSFVTLQAL